MTVFNYKQFVDTIVSTSYKVHDFICPFFDIHFCLQTLFCVTFTVDSVEVGKNFGNDEKPLITGFSERESERERHTIKIGNCGL